MSEVFNSLKETFDIDIEFQKDSLSGCVLTSGFYEEGLYDRIDVICTAIRATYQVDTGTAPLSERLHLKRPFHGTSPLLTPVYRMECEL